MWESISAAHKLFQRTLRKEVRVALLERLVMLKNVIIIMRMAK